MDDAAERLLDMAANALNDGKYRDAITFAKEVQEVHPSSGEAKLIEAIALSKSGDSISAAQAFQRAIVLEPRNAKLRYNAGIHALNTQDFVRARELALDTLDIEPGHAGAQEILSKVPKDTPESDRQAIPEEIVLPKDISTVGINTGYARGEAAQIDVAASGIEFIKRLGAIWFVIGFGIAFLLLVMFVLTLPQLGMGKNWVLGTFGGITLLSSLTYMVLEFIHRQRSPIWLFVHFPLTCAGLGFITLAVYCILEFVNHIKEQSKSSV